MRLRARLGPPSAWAASATLAGFVLVALAARAGPVPSGPADAVAQPSSPSTPRATATPQSDQLTGVPPSDSGRLRVPWSLIELLLLAILLVAVIAITLVLWPQWRGRLRSRRSRQTPRPFEPAPDDLIRQVSSTLRTTMSQVAGGQVRDAVILCWRRLEETAELAGLRRSPADTSSELVDRLLASMPLSEAPLNRLAALYREARFSSHPIPAEAVAQARADLVRLRSELEAAAGLWTGAGHG
ncbi:MAG TPA: DUF4129 domain-containing protein [Jatrophihabitans sp.]|jgi:hypothetical protein